MRELKFRLWSDSLQVMYSPDNQIGGLWSIAEAPNGILKTKEGDILMQFIDYKDKNGKEIYKGDIARIKDATNNDGYSNHEILFDWRGAGIIKDDVHIRLDMLSEVEIIGDIHQNPELK